MSLYRSRCGRVSTHCRTGRSAEHAVDQVSRELAHAPATARRTETPPLTRESDQDLAPCSPST